MKRFMVSAMNSGAGKTVITCALLSAMQKEGLSVHAFKCGPDYIDPMFHSQVLGVPSKNLDLFLLGEAALKKTLFCCQADLAILEGAMGFYDGLSRTTDNSAWEIAHLTDTPVLLVLRPAGVGITLAAQIQGLLHFRRESNIRALLLSDCRKSLAAYYTSILEKECGIPVLGFLPPMEEAVFSSRHLGLCSPEEISDFSRRISVLADTLQKHTDLPRLLDLAADSPSAFSAPNPIPPVCRIAVARDKAFSFLYEGSLEALYEAGAEIVFFSPLQDACPPPDIDGLYLCGGYPELFAAELAENAGMRGNIRNLIKCGLPTVAECGGFLYLQQELEDPSGKRYPMCGVLPGTGYRTDSLQHFGYQWIIPEQDSLLFRKGEKIPAHEFHYWDCTCNGSSFTALKPGGQSWRSGFATNTLYAAFPHLHLGGLLPLASRFINKARAYRS